MPAPLHLVREVRCDFCGRPIRPGDIHGTIGSGGWKDGGAEGMVLAGPQVTCKVKQLIDTHEEEVEIISAAV